MTHESDRCPKERGGMHPLRIVLAVLGIFGWWVLLWITGLLGVLFGGVVIGLCAIVYGLIRRPSDRDHPIPSTD